jgi:hypothetical protein
MSKLFKSPAARKELATARKLLRAMGINTLLADPLSNPKFAKGSKVGVLTAPMHLAPASLSGFNVCAKATAGCKAACLHTAGNPAYMAGKARARNARTVAYFKARASFMVVLAGEIAAHEQRAKKQDMDCAVRLNATSDIPWEIVPVTVDGRSYPNLMAAFPEVTFYDYTKIAKRATRALPANYSLTFSLAENNDTDAARALVNGMNVAAVFGGITPKSVMPSAFNLAGIWHRVIDGDVHDFRPADDKGVIVGLRAKGKARGDKSGFVRSFVRG